MSRKKKNKLEHPGDESRGPNRWNWNRLAAIGAGAALVLAVVLVFGQTTRHRFVNYDDDQYVYENPNISGGLTWRGLSWMMTHHHVGNWHPLTTLSHMLDCQFYGLEPAGHHVTNVLLHAISVILLFVVLRQMTGAMGPSLFVAAVFAIHPLRVESVAWISERKDVLSGVFFMLILWAYTRYARKPFSIWRYLAVFGFLACGLMSKPVLVTMPLLLLVLDYWPLRRIGWPLAPGAQAPEDAAESPSLRRVLVEKIPLMLLSVAFCVVTFFTQQITIESTESLPVGLRIANAAVSYVLYLRDMVFPANLAPFYAHPRNTLAIWKAIVAGLILVGVSATALALRRKHPWLLVGWLWYLGTLIPVIGLVQVGAQARADRYTYLTQIGIYIAIAWGIAAWLQARPRFRLGVGAVATVVLVCLLVRASVQTAYWKNSLTLWTRALACATPHHNMRLNMGNALLESGQVEAAIEQFHQALKLKPDYAMAHNNLGMALLIVNRLDEGLQHFQEAIRISPQFAQAHYNLGSSLARQGKLDQAMLRFKEALRLNPDFAEAYNNLGAALDSQGKPAQAIAHYRRALELQPRYADAHYNLGNALSHLGRHQEAIAQWKVALQVQPNYAKAHFAIGNSCYLQKRMDEAMAHYRAALAINPGFVEAEQNLRIVMQQEGLLNRTSLR